MQDKLEQDLKRTTEIMSYTWKIQTNQYDKTTNFIYKMNSLDECLIEIERTGVDKNYALHRWYNYMTSIKCEYIFCEYGAIHETNKYNHDVDIYIDYVPFDVKLTVYPTKLSNRPYDLTTRTGKNEMIHWYYSNQSQQNRKQLLNRLYVVCDAPTPIENIVMKSDFDLMRQRISTFMKELKIRGFNEIVINDGENKYPLKSDIILLKKEI